MPRTTVFVFWTGLDVVIQSQISIAGDSKSKDFVTPCHLNISCYTNSLCIPTVGTNRSTAARRAGQCGIQLLGFFPAGSCFKGVHGIEQKTRHLSWTFAVWEEARGRWMWGMHQCGRCQSSSGQNQLSPTHTMTVHFNTMKESSDELWFSI